MWIGANVSIVDEVTIGAHSRRWHCVSSHEEHSG